MVGNAQVLLMDSFPVRTQHAAPGFTGLTFCSRWKERVSYSRRRAVWEPRLLGSMTRSASTLRAAAAQVPKGTDRPRPVLAATQTPGPPGHTTAPVTPPGATEEGQEEDPHTRQSPDVSGALLRDFRIFKPSLTGGESKAQER